MAYVVKRYSNRKLYDIQESRYVTLEELEEMIRAGKEISVVDATTGEDMTSVTLAQIILENERNRRAGLPTAFLHQIIKYGEAWQEFIRGSLRASLEGITASQRETDRIFKEWAVRSGLIPPAEQPARERKAQAPNPDPENLQDELEALKEKLEMLEKKLGRKKRQ